MNRLKKGSRDELVSPGEAIRYMIKRTESPIEKMFAEAWGDLLDEKNWPERTLIFNYGPFKYLPEVTIYSPLNYMAADFFCPQLEVGEYRVDFVLGRIAYDISWDADGNSGDEILRKLPPIAVECDGHDFHERTKEQAERDRSRDRWFTSEGFRVMRFTGREIYRNAAACAKEVDEMFERLLMGN